MTQQQADAVIIGAGMGGMCAAARLTAAGLKVIVLEKSPHLGGRCSHRERDGFTVTTGAIMIPMGANSAIREAFDAVGADMDMVETTGRVRYRLDHGDYDLPETGGGLLGMITFAMEGDSTGARELFQHFREAIGVAAPDEKEMMRDWLERHLDRGTDVGRHAGAHRSADGPARQILEAGAQGFIQKPVLLKTLSQALKEFLAEHGVRPYREMPVWMPPSPGREGFARFDLGPELEAGLTFRPLSVSAGDTLEFHFSRPVERRESLRAGLTAAREAEILMAWHAVNG